MHFFDQGSVIFLISALLWVNVLFTGAQFQANGPRFYSQIIAESLGIENVAVLMGANIATDVAKKQFVESTLACQDLDLATSMAEIFQCQTFQVQICQDTITTEICGALKNVIAMGAGCPNVFVEVILQSHRIL